MDSIPCSLLSSQKDLWIPPWDSLPLVTWDDLNQLWCTVWKTFSPIHPPPSLTFNLLATHPSFFLFVVQIFLFQAYVLRLKNTYLADGKNTVPQQMFLVSVQETATRWCGSAWHYFLSGETDAAWIYSFYCWFLFVFFFPPPNPLSWHCSKFDVSVTCSHFAYDFVL